MTVDLHKWSGEEQLSQLKHYAAKNTPATTTLLSYLVNTKESTIAPLDELSIWTTHPDPLHTNDIVIWMLEWQHRVRLFVNSEIQLESSELTEKAIKYSHGEERKGNNYAYFKDEKDEQLYRRALDKVEQVVTWFIEDTYKNDKDMVVCETNVLWISAFYKHYKVGMDMPHCKFLKKASAPIEVMDLPEHLERTSQFSEEDLLLVQSSNKIEFDLNYLKDCSRIAAGIRRKDTKELVAWSLSHRDFASAALHVLPDFRRQGLADAVLADLCKLQRDYFQKELPDVPLSQFYFSGFVHSENTPSLNFFKKAGFEPVGLGASWMELNRK